MTHPIILAVLLSAGPVSGLHGQSTTTGTTGPMPVIELERTRLIDTVHIDSVNAHRTYTFLLKNTGNAPLIIDRVTGSDPCYCSHWPHGPVQPTDTTTLKVACPPLHGAGSRQQTFLIHSNAAAPVIFNLRRIGLPRHP